MLWARAGPGRPGATNRAGAGPSASTSAAAAAECCRPVELTERQLRDAIAVIGERHEHGGQAAESALGWLG